MDITYKSFDIIDRQLLLFTINKKKWKDDWYTKDLKPDNYIFLSKNGWINNKLCIK